MSNYTRALEVLQRGVSSRVFPGASVEAGTAASPVWREAVGSLTYEPDAPRVSAATVFDLASLTKPIATATIAMRLVEAGKLSLGDAIGDYEAGWRGDDRSAVSVRHLLEHTSGLAAWAPLWRDHAGRDGIVGAILELPLEYEPGRRSVYSDLGFIVLGSVLERAGGARLDQLFEAITRGWSGDDDGADRLVYNPPSAWTPRIAPTRFSESRARLLVGEVDDDNAWAMGGIAGHAGLFGAASAVGTFARAVLHALSGERQAGQALAESGTLRLFLTPSTVPGSSRALAWDLMRDTSSCGSMMSASAFGHTGFTGTSLWIDPAQDFYAVLLANRVHPEPGPGAPMQDVRRAFHDALMEGRPA